MLLREIQARFENKSEKTIHVGLSQVLSVFRTVLGRTTTSQETRPPLLSTQVSDLPPTSFVRICAVYHRQSIESKRQPIFIYASQNTLPRLPTQP